jgi:hypothetical protein
MYKSDKYILALGTIEDTSIIRYSILTTVKKGGRTDLYGLRLGISAMDTGPYAHRVYGRRLLNNGDHDRLTNTTGALAKADDARMGKLRQLIDDFDEVLDLLKKDSPPGGLGLALPLEAV